jgi:hypothetical protein
VVHSLIVLGLAIGMLILVQRRLIQIDLFFPWFVSITVLGVASTSPAFVEWLGAALGILYPPIAVIFLVFFLLLGVIVSLTISVTRLRQRLGEIAKHQALLELAQQERLIGETGVDR